MMRLSTFDLRPLSASNFDDLKTLDGIPDLDPTELREQCFLQKHASVTRSGGIQ